MNPEKKGFEIMHSFIKNLRRFVAAVLVLLLFPYASVYAKENNTVLTVACSDIFHQDTVCTTTILETNSGYYITLPNAVDMLGLKQIGDHYVTPNGLVSVYPDTKNLESISYNGEDWYSLEQLMTRLDTVILEADGNLYYSCVPINQSLLQAETSRIMIADLYNAFFLEDLPGLSALTVFSFAFNNLWNQPVDALTGKAYANDVGALLLEVLKHHEGSDSLARIMSERLEGINEVQELVLETHDGLEAIFELGGSQLRGGGYLLFGIEGTGLLHELLEANNVIAQTGLDISDVLGVIAQLYETGKLPKIYADALTRVLDTTSAKNYSDAVILTQAERTLQIYHDCLEDNRAALVAEGVMMTAEDIAKNIITDRVLKETLSVKLTKVAIEILDTVPGNPFENTFKKNKFVQNAALCVKLQTFVRSIYNSNNVDRCDADAALVLRDAAMLYLKTAWTAYDAAGFDSAIAGAVRNAQSRIDDELVLLAGFTDNMFYIQDNEPLPAGCLNNKGSTDAGGEKQPEDNGSAERNSYYAFLSTNLYVNYIANPVIRQVCAQQYIENYFTFRDVNSDGVQELILMLGYTGADGETMFFTLEDGKIRYMGSAPCDGTGTYLFFADHDDDFFVAAFDGDSLYADSYRIVRGSLKKISADADIPQRWYCVDWVGSLPLTAADMEKVPDAPQNDKVQAATRTAWREFVKSDACVFYLENEDLFDKWLRDYLAISYWFEDVDNNGSEELIVWAAGPDSPGKITGEIMVFANRNGQVVCVGNLVCNSHVSLSGHAQIPGFLIAHNDGGLEKLTLCRMEEQGLVTEENYMVTDTFWYALKSGVEPATDLAPAPEM